MKRYKLIVNADDLGYNTDVNNAIENAIIHGVISSTTIMANSTTLDEVYLITKKYPHVSYGVHLNLTEGKSTTANTILKKYGLIDDNNCFAESNREKIPLIICDELKTGIEEEWNAQLSVVRQTGIQISHLDGHHHCNSWCGLEDVFVKVALKNNIKKVRNGFCFPMEINYKHSILHFFSLFIPSVKLSNNYLKKKIHKYQHIFDNTCALDNKIKESKLVSTDGFTSFSSLISLKNAFERKRYHSCNLEVMCHPGNPLYIMETQKLMNDALECKQNSCFVLISYNEL